MVAEVEELHRRIAQLEDWRRELDISRAREDENRKHMDARFDALEKRLTDMTEWILWVIKIGAGAVIVAAVTFVIKGGLVG